MKRHNANAIVLFMIVTDGRSTPGPKQKNDVPVTIIK